MKPNKFQTIITWHDIDEELPPPAPSGYLEGMIYEVVTDKGSVMVSHYYGGGKDDWIPDGWWPEGESIKYWGTSEHVNWPFEENE
jgi:hypothetical protein